MYFPAPEGGTAPVQLHMAISPLSFNIFIHALQVSSSSGDFNCNRKIPSMNFAPFLTLNGSSESYIVMMHMGLGHLLPLI